MKRAIFCLTASLFLIVSAALTQSQDVDLLYLKNGSIIRGQVIELNSSSVKIRTTDGSLFVYSMSEVEKMVKESTSASSTLSSPTDATEPTAAPAAIGAAPVAPKSGVSFGLHGGLGANLEIWDQLQGNPDSKIGFGLTGDLAMGIAIDNDMYVGVGPLFAGSFWSESKKVDGVSTSMSMNVVDVGGNLFFGFDDMYITMGAGSASVSTTVTVGSDSKTVDMPENASFRRVGLGWSDGLSFGIAYTSYADWAKDLSRFEINVGFRF